MIHYARAYLKGTIDSFNSLPLLLKILQNDKTRKEYNYLLIYNIFICLPINFLLQKYPLFFKDYFNFHNSWLFNFYYLLTIIIWNFPHYIIGLMYNGYYTNKSITSFIEVFNSPNLHLKYHCYDRSFFPTVTTVSSFARARLTRRLPIIQRH